MNETAGKRGVAGVMLTISGIGLLVVLVTLLTTLRTPPEAVAMAGQDISPLYSTANGWLTLVIGLLLIPSFVDSIRLLRGSDRSLLRLNGGIKAATIVLVASVAAALLVNSIFAQGGTIASAIAAFLQVLVVAAPIWWFLELGRYRLPALSARRGWAITGISLVLTMPLVMVIEIVILGMVLIAVGVWMTSQPDLLQQFETLREIIQTSGSDPEVLLPYMQDLMRQPGVVLGLAAMIGGVMPLVEELLKPLGLWAFAITRRRLTPAEGFVGGLICGAIFALLESGLRLIGVMPDVFAESALARFGSDMLHMTASALVGWGLGLAWTEGRYLRLGVQFLAAVALHCVWNLSALLPALAAFQAESAAAENLSTTLAFAMPFILAAEVVVFFVVIVRGRNALRATLPPAPPLPPVVTEEADLAILSNPVEPTEPPQGTNLD